MSAAWPQLKWKQPKATCQQEFLVVQLFMKSDCARFRKLVEDVQNSYLTDKKTSEDSGYPTNLTEVLHILTHYKNDTSHNIGQPTVEPGVAFSQQEEDTKPKANEVLKKGTKTKGACLPKQQNKQNADVQH